MSSPKIVQDQDKEAFETINKFVQKELILNSIENSLESEKLGVLQRVKCQDEPWMIENDVSTFVFSYK